MDLTQMNLNELNILWLASGGNVDLKLAIEDEFQKRIENNQNYSREYLFQTSEIQNRVITIHFIPESQAYNKYGSNITIIKMLVDDEELIEFGNNFITNPPINTYGNIKVNILVTDDLSEGQIAEIASDGFDTSNILTIQHI